MSLITGGLGPGSGLITRGLGSSFISRMIQRGTDRLRKWFLGVDQKVFVKTKIKGTTQLPLVFLGNIKANVAKPYQIFYNLYGNTLHHLMIERRVRGHYKRPFLFETRTQGKKSFVRMLLEIILDDEDD